MGVTSPSYAYFLFRRAFIGSICCAVCLMIAGGVMSKLGGDVGQFAPVFRRAMFPVLGLFLAIYVVCGWLVVFWQCPNCKKSLHFCRERWYGNAFGRFCDNCGFRIRPGTK